MGDYALDNSDYERLKAERDLAVRVAVFFETTLKVWGTELPPSWAKDSDKVMAGVTWGDVRKVLAWYREAQNIEKGGE